MSEALKYSDRDVRENPDFESLAEEYLENYEGEFDFLVDCKMRVASGRHLSTGMVRGVLNCMRVDPRLPYDLPEPLPPEEGVVVPMKRKKQKREEVYDCPLTERGIYHSHKIMPRMMRYCSGLYRINRSGSRTKLRIHAGLHAKAKSDPSFLIHKVASDPGEILHNAEWSVPPHEYGWYDVWRGPHFNVKLGCKYPSWLRDPLLVTEEQVEEYNRDPIKIKGKPVIWKYCPRCFPPFD